MFRKGPDKKAVAGGDAPKAAAAGASGGAVPDGKKVARPSGTPDPGGKRPVGSAGPGKPDAAQMYVTSAPNFNESLPTFKDTPKSEQQVLFLKKLVLCSVQMDFSESVSEISRPANSKGDRNKEIKRLNLLEIMDYINTTKGVFNDATYEPITEMISANLFRGLAPTAEKNGQYDPEEDEPTLELSWPHLQYVYEFLLRFVVSNETDPKVVKKYISQDFLVKLLDLFDSEDPRERDYLKTILHRIYGKFMPYRAFIRKSINNIFYRFIYETPFHNGIAELLEILGSIINGFALPLKEEHKTFLTKALLPLHKVNHVSMYHQQLSYCVTQFVEKDPQLAELVLGSILTFWPRTQSQKEVLFLNEVEEILEMVNVEAFGPVVPALFARISDCVSSPHFQVAERALFLWNNEYIVSLIAQFRREVLPIVFASLYTNSRNHWNTTVHGLTCNVVKLFMEMDPALFDTNDTTYKQQLETKPEREKKIDDTWEAIFELAKGNPLHDPLQAKGLLQESKRAAPHIIRNQFGIKYRHQPDESGSDTAHRLGMLAGQGRVGKYADGMRVGALTGSKVAAPAAVTGTPGSLSATPTSDALRRKSMIPGKKSE